MVCRGSETSINLVRKGPTLLLPAAMVRRLSETKQEMSGIGRGSIAPE